MSAYDCGEGVPKRCFIIENSQGEQRAVCYCISQWPTWYLPAYPKHPGPDPGPELYIEGIRQETMQELMTLDIINHLATHVNGEVGDSIRESVGRGYKSIQSQLPKGISLGEVK
jgi:hypothetical protein